MLSETDISGLLGLTAQQAREAIDFLLSQSYAEKRAGIPLMISAQAALFVNFDKAWIGTNTVQTAKRVAQILAEKESFVATAEIATALVLTPRQLNPAISFLLRSGIAEKSRNVDVTFAASSLGPTVLTRQFVFGEWPPKTRLGQRG